jgi:dUTP pyrophosphatase
MDNVKIEKIDEKAQLPTYGTNQSAGADLRACLDESIIIRKNSRELIQTGLKMKIPSGYEGQIRPRSGLALKQGITVLNSPGTIDSDYRGPIGVILYNTTSSDVTITNGDRIAQIVFAKVGQPNFVETKIESDTERAEGGFGSTGTN